MSMDLYNRFRPRSFSDMFKTSDVVNFQSQLEATLEKKGIGGISHALLFESNFPGLGKTTSGRIIAAQINPGITEDERDRIFTGRDNPVCFEMNIADLRKIDDARRLDDRINELRDSMHPYNYVFILDELHKMIPEAQEVLLKTTENIPPNVYIICTTTSLSTINPMLISRFEQHTFFPLTRQLLGKLLLDITEKAGYEIKLDDRVIDQIFECTEGAPRASIVALSNYLKNGTLPTTMVSDTDTMHVGELINRVVSAARGVEKKPWSQVVAPYAYGLCREHKVEEIRIGMLLMLGRLVTETTSAPVLRVYYELIEEFKTPIVGPPEKSMFVLKLFQVNVRSINLDERDIRAPKPKQAE